MTAETLLSRLERVKRTGPDRWHARCPAHDDKGPSLAIREIDDGRTLVHCFAGCSAQDVVAAVSLSLSDLMPPRALAVDRVKGERRPFPAADVLRAIGFEALVVLTSGAALLTGQSFTETDRARLTLAVARIQSALDAAGVGHG